MPFGRRSWRIHALVSVALSRAQSRDAGLSDVESALGCFFFEPQRPVALSQGAAPQWRPSRARLIGCRHLSAAAQDRLE